MTSSPIQSTSEPEGTKALVLILGMAVLVRAAFAIGTWLIMRDPGVFYMTDTGSYVVPARELLARGTFTARGEPELLRTPGYPLFLLPGMWLGHLVTTTIAANKVSLTRIEQ